MRSDKKKLIVGLVDKNELIVARDAHVVPVVAIGVLDRVAEIVRVDAHPLAQPVHLKDVALLVEHERGHVLALVPRLARYPLATLDTHGGHLALVVKEHAADAVLVAHTPARVRLVRHAEYDRLLIWRATMNAVRLTAPLALDGQHKKGRLWVFVLTEVAAFVELEIEHAARVLAIGVSDDDALGVDEERVDARRILLEALKHVELVVEHVEASGVVVESGETAALALGTERDHDAVSIAVTVRKAGQVGERLDRFEQCAALVEQVEAQRTVGGEANAHDSLASQRNDLVAEGGTTLVT